MRIISGLGRKTKQAVACAALVVPVAGAWAQGVPVEDEDLGGVWGQAMFSVDNQDNVGGLDFTRITLNADVKLNANLYNIQLGKVGSNPADVDIGEMRFVSSGASGVDPYVKLIDPYIEFVYKNQSAASADPTQREIIGLRMGFKEINGNLGLKINGLKGNVVLADPNPTAPTYGNLTLANTRSTDFVCPGCTTGTLAMSQVGSVSASGPTDFYISLLSQAVTFSDTTTALDGVFVNWTKGVSYTNTNGTILANPLPSLQKRQGG